MDSRGDVGAWVREAAMTALQVTNLIFIQCTSQIISLFYNLCFGSLGTYLTNSKAGSLPFGSRRDKKNDG